MLIKDLITISEQISKFTHKISASLTKQEVNDITREAKENKLNIQIKPVSGGHNSGSSDQYYDIIGSEEDLKIVCDFSADTYGYFDESNIKKI